MANNTGLTAGFKCLLNIAAKWRRRTGTERWLLVEAFFLLGVARLVLLIMPFKWLAVTLGRYMEETGTEMKPADACYARIIGRAVCSAANYTPWKSVCLPQAVAAQWMLKRRHIAGTLYLGVAKNETPQLKITAHAWLRCGNLILTGREGHRRFTVVAKFS
jgi:hypothetical protein